MATKRAMPVPAAAPNTAEATIPKKYRKGDLVLFQRKKMRWQKGVRTQSEGLEMESVDL